MKKYVSPSMCGKTNIFFILSLVAIMLTSLGYYYNQIKGREGMDGEKKEEEKKEEKKEMDFTNNMGPGKASICPTYKKPDNKGGCI